MDIPVRLAELEGQKLALHGTAFSGPKLMLNGRPVVGKKGVFNLRSNAGTTVTIKFKPRFLDPVPDLVVSGRTVTLIPPLQWYQYAMIAIPMILVFIGGAIGGFFGGLGAYMSSRVFRSDLSDGTKYGVSGAVALAAFASYFIVAGLSWLRSRNNSPLAL